MRIDPADVVVFPAVVLSVVVHECAHGVAALWLGDTTARDKGRLTLNPIPHLDLVGSILLPLSLVLFHAPFLFGWAKPVPVNWANLRNPRNDPVKVALAGPASNFVLAFLFALVVRVSPESGFWAPLRDMGYAGVLWNCGLGLFNLIPIPPLDGSWVLMRFLPMRHIIVLHQFRMLGMAMVVLMLSSPIASGFLIDGPLRVAVRTCLALAGVSAQGEAI